MTNSLNALKDGDDIVAAKTDKGSEILLYRFGSGALPVLLLGGVHGDESEGFLCAERFIDSFRNGALRIPEGLSLYISPRLNPDGCAALRRTNHGNVDLNRNLPTGDWTDEFTNVRYYPGRAAGSEPESKLTIRLIEELDPAVVFSLHSYENAMINFNGDCEDLAVVMSRKNGLPPKGDIGYPTPGSLGTYGGWERNIPVITLEIFRGEEPDKSWEKHREALLDGFSYYLNRARPAKKQV